MIRVTVEGGRAFRARMAASGPIIDSELDIAAEEMRVLVERTAKNLAPMRTGRLRGAISATLRRQAGVFVAGGDVRGHQIEVRLSINSLRAPYGVYVDRGTGIYAGHEEWSIRAHGAPFPFKTPDKGLIFRRTATIRGAHGRDFLDGAIVANEEVIRARFAEAGEKIARKLA